MPLIVSLFVAAGLSAASSTEPYVQPPSAPVPAAAATPNVSDGDVVVCKTRAVTGTRFSTRECKTKTEWVNLTREARDFVDRSTHKGCNPNGC